MFATKDTHCVPPPWLAPKDMYGATPPMIGIKDTYGASPHGSSGSASQLTLSNGAATLCYPSDYQSVYDSWHSQATSYLMALGQVRRLQEDLHVLFLVVDQQFGHRDCLANASEQAVEAIVHATSGLQILVVGVLKGCVGSTALRVAGAADYIVVEAAAELQLPCDIRASAAHAIEFGYASVIADGDHELQVICNTLLSQIRQLAPQQISKMKQGLRQNMSAIDSNMGFQKPGLVEAAPQPGKKAAVNNRAPQRVRRPTEPVALEGPITTLMIRHIPCRITQQQLASTIDEFGFEGKYDLLYLPTGSSSPTSNLGYGFVNFREEVDAAAFWAAFDGHRFAGTDSKKTCAVKPAHVQGFVANVRDIRNALARHPSRRPFIAEDQMGSFMKPATQSLQAASL